MQLSVGRKVNNIPEDESHVKIILGLSATTFANDGRHAGRSSGAKSGRDHSSGYQDGGCPYEFQLKSFPICHFEIGVQPIRECFPLYNATRIWWSFLITKRSFNFRELVSSFILKESTPIMSCEQYQVEEPTSKSKISLGKQNIIS